VKDIEDMEVDGVQEHKVFIVILFLIVAGSSRQRASIIVRSSLL
jgi:hypothetical protein